MNQYATYTRFARRYAQNFLELRQEVEARRAKIQSPLDKEFYMLSFTKDKMENCRSLFLDAMKERRHAKMAEKPKEKTTPQSEVDTWFMWHTLLDIKDEITTVQNGGGEYTEAFREMVLKELDAIRELLDDGLPTAEDVCGILSQDRDND